MKQLFITTLCILLIAGTSVQASSHNQTFRYDRLRPDNSAMLLIDHQTGLATGIRDSSLPEYYHGVEALVDYAIAWDLPVIISTSNHEGPNGPLLQYIIDNLPRATLIHRPGQINAFDNEEFTAAVEALGVKKLIMSGISTDVCLTFASLKGVELGYDVYAVIDASGTFSEIMRDLAISRMQHAGVHIMTWFAVGCELLEDWRNEGGQDFADILNKHLPFYGSLIQSYNVHSQLNLNETAAQPEEIIEPVPIQPIGPIEPIEPIESVEPVESLEGDQGLPLENDQGPQANATVTEGEDSVGATSSASVGGNA